MKIFKTLLILLMVGMIVPAQAEDDMTAEQVVENYLETVGGADAWANVTEPCATAF